MQTDYVYPTVGDRWSPNEWNERGRPDYVARAVTRTREILRHHHPGHISGDELRRGSTGAMMRGDWIALIRLCGGLARPLRVRDAAHGGETRSGPRPRRQRAGREGSAPSH